MNPNENYMNQMPLPGTQPKSGGAGPVVAVIIIIALLAFGGWYFWKQVQDRNATNDQTVNPELQATTTRGINTELEADITSMQNDDLGESDAKNNDNEFSQ